jgi:hypothetical protein
MEILKTGGDIVEVGVICGLCGREIKSVEIKKVEDIDKTMQNILDSCYEVAVICKKTKRVAILCLCDECHRKIFERR